MVRAELVFGNWDEGIEYHREVIALKTWPDIYEYCEALANQIMGERGLEYIHFNMNEKGKNDETLD